MHSAKSSHAVVVLSVVHGWPSAMMVGQTSFCAPEPPMLQLPRSHNTASRSHGAPCAANVMVVHLWEVASQPKPAAQSPPLQGPPLGTGCSHCSALVQMRPVAQSEAAKHDAPAFPGAAQIPCMKSQRFGVAQSLSS
jgi:hypothetical protein